ncbi:MAG: hypothetical protein C5B60_11040 [Chloroflexi bacterium]|nr:MAG: hypothetical protein C5B60_11040 [Chloroflexota bacterium]
MGMDPQQPGYGGPPPPPPYGAPGPSAGSKWGPTSMGMEAHIAAGLSYIWILGLIFFFVEKSNRFVRFHAAQAILLGIGGVVLFFIWIVLGIISAAIAATDQTGIASLAFGCIFTCIPALLALGLFALSVWGLIAGFTGNYVKMPIIGDIAERWAGGAIPA